jgi:hypothetical protein
MNQATSHVSESLRKHIFDYINKTDAAIKEEHFQEGRSVKVMRNKKTHVIYAVKRGYDYDGNHAYCFYPLSRSARKPFFKTELTNYEDAGTAHQNKILTEKLNNVDFLNYPYQEMNMLLNTFDLKD